MLKLHIKHLDQTKRYFTKTKLKKKLSHSTHKENRSQMHIGRLHKIDIMILIKVSRVSAYYSKLTQRCGEFNIFLIRCLIIHTNLNKLLLWKIPLFNAHVPRAREEYITSNCQWLNSIIMRWIEVHFRSIHITACCTIHLKHLSKQLCDNLISNFRNFVDVFFLSCGRFPNIWIFCADILEHSVCSIFIGCLNDLWRRNSDLKRQPWKFRSWAITQKQEYNNVITTRYNSVEHYTTWWAALVPFSA